MISAEVVSYISELLIGKLSEQSVCRLPEEGVEGRAIVHCTRERRLQLISYTNDPEEMERAWVVIRPSRFFEAGVYGTAEVEPRLPLAEWEGIPLLYGEPRHEWINEGRTLLLHADLIASVFYLISRYEEMYKRHERDALGRFPASASLPVRAGFLHRPLVEEYAEALRRLLREGGIAERAGVQVEPLGSSLSGVRLTHDLDKPYQYRGFEGLCSALGAGVWHPLRLWAKCFGAPEQDSYFTFPDFLQWNSELREAMPEGLVETRLFVRRPSGHPLDRPDYRLRTAYMRRVLSVAREHKAAFGLLCSYRASEQTQRIGRELAEAEHRLEQEYINSSRHHRLALREPEDMLELLGQGIRHDYSMGYAECSGFRLGTCRPVRFINPNTRRLTELIMHPLTLSDESLSAMGLSYEEAVAYSRELIATTARYGGELILSWRSDQLSHEAHPWHRELYRALLLAIPSIGLGDRRADGEVEQALKSRQVKREVTSASTLEHHPLTESKIKQPKL